MCVGVCMWVWVGMGVNSGWVSVNRMCIVCGVHIYMLCLAVLCCAVLLYVHNNVCVYISRNVYILTIYMSVCVTAVTAVGAMCEQ